MSEVGLQYFALGFTSACLLCVLAVLIFPQVIDRGEGRSGRGFSGDLSSETQQDPPASILQAGLAYRQSPRHDQRQIGPNQLGQHRESGHRLISSRRRRVVVDRGKRQEHPVRRILSERRSRLRISRTRNRKMTFRKSTCPSMQFSCSAQLRRSRRRQMQMQSRRKRRHRCLQHSL